MSELRVDNIVSQDGSTAPTYTYGINVAAGKTITNDGHFVVNGDTTLAGTVQVTNTGVTTISGTLDVTNTGVSTFSGGLRVGGAATITGSLDVVGGGTLNTSGIITASLIDVTSEIQYANLAVLTGNVGLGTTSGYGGRLNVNDSIIMSTGIQTTYDTKIQAVSNDGGGISFEDLDGGQQYFSITKDTTYLFAVNDTSANEKFVVTGTGSSVGVNTDMPTAHIDVIGGDARVGRNENEGIVLTSNNGSQFRIKVDNSGNLSTTAL